MPKYPPKSRGMTFSELKWGKMAPSVAENLFGGGAA